MLADPKARVAITDFYNQWIGTSRLDITSKSTTLFPAYTDAVRDRDEGRDARVRRSTCSGPATTSSRRC